MRKKVMSIDNIDNDTKLLEEKILNKQQEILEDLSPWDKILLARHPQRPYFLNYVESIFTDFLELRGDRVFGEDSALVGGFAKLDGEKVMLLGQQKGRELRERTKRNFGMSHPEGYRKAMRLMRLAEQVGVPIITFIDTPGAYPGLASEERHVGEAIAVNLRDCFGLKVPIISTIIGEGGSGGALGIGIADRVLMLQNSYYSVISPEGCASILWKDISRVADATEQLKIGAKDLLKLGIIDKIIKEPNTGAHSDSSLTFSWVKKAIIHNLKELKKDKISDLLTKRYQRFRKFGQFSE